MAATPFPEDMHKSLMPGLFEEHEDDDTSGLDRGDELASDEPDMADESAADEPNVEAPVGDEPEDEPEGDGPESDDEPTEESEVEEPEVEEPEAPKQKQKIMIPKTRLDDEIAKRRKLENELKQIRAEREAKPTDDKADEAFEAVIKEANALLRQANEAVLDGDLDKAAQLQQDALVKMAAAKQAPAKSTDADPEAMIEQLEARIELKHTIKNIYEKFPMLNNESEDADPELIERAVMYERMYAEMGHTPAMAVERAVQDAIALLRPELLQAERPVSQPRVDPAKKRVQEKRQNLESKVALAQKQPPKAQSSTTSEPTIDPLVLSEEEFDALPESTKARLRGDFS
jgi:hypothetical protein